MADKAEKTEKAAKIIDIKSPDKAAPSASSRPLLVTNRSVITNDPMVNPSAEPGDGKPAEPMARTAKTIKPISTDITEPEKEEDVPTEAVQPEVEAESNAETETEVSASSDSPVVTETPAELAKPAESTESAKPAEAPSPEPSKTEDNEEVGPEPISRDVEAASQADEAKAVAVAEAEAARQEELEQLIESGRFSAPINAAHRKRSRTVAVVLCIVAFVLAVAIFDAVLDAGIVQVGGIPHTDFLKDN